jgi:hypothetical protein
LPVLPATLAGFFIMKALEQLIGFIENSHKVAPGLLPVHTVEEIGDAFLITSTHRGRVTETQSITRLEMLEWQAMSGILPSDNENTVAIKYYESWPQTGIQQ